MVSSIRVGLAAVTMCCLAAAIVDAKPRVHRVAVADFDGAHQLADAGRAAVLSALGDDTNVVSAKEWSDALGHASGHGPGRWLQAAKETDVDVVIEGWVQPEGGGNRLTIAVRDARTGAEIRTFSLAIDERGIPTHETRRLASHLHHVLDQLDDHARDADPPARTPHRTAERPADDEPAATDRKSTDLPVDEDHSAVDSDARPRPRFDVDGGPFVAGRGVTFSHAPSEMGELPFYPGHRATGIGVHGDAYPLPRDNRGRPLTGPGVTLDVHKSLASSTATGGYTLDTLAWELGIHYRYPLAPTTIDVDLDGGSVAYKLVDRPASVIVPNASYSYLGGGAHVDFAATPEVTVGAGAHLMYLLGVGEMGETSWYGAGLASGLALDANGVFELSEPLYLKAAIDYRRVAIHFDGSGTITQMTGRMTMVDSAIAGAVSLGVRF